MAPQRHKYSNAWSQLVQLFGGGGGKRPGFSGGGVSLGAGLRVSEALVILARLSV